MQPALYLIPSLLGDTPVERVLPEYNRQIILGIKHFIVEDERTARRFLKAVDRTIDIDQLTFFLLNKHTLQQDVPAMLRPLEEGMPVGVISEAGCPAVADPGADVVAIAQQRRLKVVPLVGPSSIILSVMAAGFNGQNFAFNGYLPIEQTERTRCIRRLEQKVYAENQTQIFIETPYRNDRLLKDLVRSLRPDTRICVAQGLTTTDESVITLTAKEWGSREGLPKIPAIFLIYR